MIWLYIIGYLLIGLVFTFAVIKFDKSWYWDDNDAFGLGLMVIIWPVAVAIVLASALGTVILKLARRKRK